jgi:hypothetical protein
MNHEQWLSVTLHGFLAWIITFFALVNHGELKLDDYGVDLLRSDLPIGDMCCVANRKHKPVSNGLPNTLFTEVVELLHTKPRFC